MENKPMYIMLADDDEDDRLFFKEAFDAIKIFTVVKSANDGVELMEYLSESGNTLPDILFLDLNMPRKSGMECLMDIKRMDHLKEIPIAIYSTSASEQDIENTFVKGANIYIKKPNDFGALKKLLEEVIKMNWHYQTSGLNRDSFLLSL